MKVSLKAELRLCAVCEQALTISHGVVQNYLVAAMDGNLPTLTPHTADCSALKKDRNHVG